MDNTRQTFRVSHIVNQTAGEAMTKFVKPADLASEFGVTRRTVDRWERRGDLPAPLKIRGTVLYQRALIEQWVRQGCPSRPMLTARQGEGQHE
jgi:predicted DNA-binding transcriptional regulator AlpA